MNKKSKDGQGAGGHLAPLDGARDDRDARTSDATFTSWARSAWYRTAARRHARRDHALCDLTLQILQLRLLLRLSLAHLLVERGLELHHLRDAEDALRDSAENERK